MDDLDDLDLTEEELYEYLHDEEDLPVTKRAVHDAILRREILPTRIGRGNFFSKRDGLDWIASRKQTGHYRLSRKPNRGGEVSHHVEMPFALVNSKAAKPEQAGQRGRCTECGGTTMPHRDEKLQWHWVHRDLTDCRGCSDPIALWHCQWEARFPAELREVVTDHDRATV